MTKKIFMIAAAASVVVVRDGERKTIQPGGGAEFTEDEIAYINGAQPGALRRPINEGAAKAAVAAAEDADEGETETKPVKKAKAAPAKPAKPEKATPAKEDADEDEDI